MSAGQPSEVDLDLLADYVGGALEGTQEAVVARLVAEDPAWAQAHAWLARASGGVREMLAEWGAEPTPMPADVVGRLTAALATADGTADPGHPDDPSGTATAAAPLDVPAGSGRAAPRVGGPHGSERPEGGARPPGRRDGEPLRPAGRGGTRSTTGRRMPRWATAVAVVAAVVALAGLGVTYLAGDDPAAENGTSALSRDSARQDGPASATMPSQLGAKSAPVRLLATGTNYSPTSLANQVYDLGREDARATAKGSSPNPQRPSKAPAPAAGVPTDQDAVSACLTAIEAAHARGPVRVEWVDAASFEGLPALVVVFVDGTGERWAWVSSPDCGQPQVGAATRYSSRVG